MPWSTGDPKIEYHRHGGGSITVDSVWNIIQNYNRYDLANSRESVAEKMTYQNRHSITTEITENLYREFFKKFEILDKLPWNEDTIDLTIEQICKSIKEDNIDQCYISMSINKYLHDTNWTPTEALKFIYDRYQTHAPGTIKILLAYKYELQGNIELSDQMIELIDGIDLVGNELESNLSKFKPILNKIDNSKIKRAHLWELPNDYHKYESVKSAGINRIAHGIFAGPEIWKQAADDGVIFDLALHSNIFIGTVKDIRKHPIKDMVNICKITLSTDDPVQFGCKLEDEFSLAIENKLITEAQATEFKQV